MNFALRRKVFYEDTQGFGNRPGLGEATPWMVRRLGIEYFRNLSETGLLQVRFETGKKAAGLGSCGSILTERFHPGRDKRSEQEGPDRSLMVGTVSLPDAPFIA
jgi:hypothetical protein